MSECLTHGTKTMSRKVPRLLSCSDEGGGDADSEKTKHLQLAGVVKSVHARLRKKFKESPENYQQVWDNHINDVDMLSNYADAMHRLATDVWSKRPDTRIHWCRLVCQEYFKDGGLRKIRDKSQRKRKYEGEKGLSPGSSFCNLSGAPHALGGSSTDFLPLSEAKMDSLESFFSGMPNEYALFSFNKAAMVCPSDIAAASMMTTFGSNSSLNVSEFSEVKTTDSMNLEQEAVDRGTRQEDVDHLPKPAQTVFGEQATLSEPRAPEVCSSYGPFKYNIISLPLRGKIRLLDVGSCFNPFAEFDEFLSVGIDISPAVTSVYRCDFLQLAVVEPLQLASDTTDTYLQTMLRSPIERLPRDCFHVIVFSLLLEYFPSPYQRWLCCQKAHRLLMVDGLLLIITPDSHSQHRNAPMMRSWKAAIESLGFRRCRYIKQEHLHCLAFRRIESDENGDNLLVGNTGPDMLYIPQDFHDADDGSAQSKDAIGSTAEQDAIMLADAFKELPNLVS